MRTDEILKEMERIGGTPSEEGQRVYAEESERAILAYLGREQLPDQVIHICAKMALWEYGGGSFAEGGRVVKEVQEGDVKVVFTEESAMDFMGKRYKAELDRYRKVRW